MCDWINLIILTSFIHSSSCAPGSWRLAIPANSQKRLLYWSADYKYRLSITNQTSGFKVTVCVQEWCWCCLGEARLHIHWMDRGQLWWRENPPRCSPPWLLGGLYQVRLHQNMFFNSVHFFSKVQSVLLLDFQVKAKSIINKFDPTLVEETLKF